MTPLAIGLVLFSALTHASWNFLLKRAGGSGVVVGISKFAEALIFAPLFLIWSLPTLRGQWAWWYLPAVGATGVLLNYLFLGMAYARGDLSFVYPIARGAILAFLPVMAYVAIGERLDAVGVIALTMILCGILVLQLPAFTREAFRAVATHARQPATLFALLAAFCAAFYTLWDKRAVHVLQPFAYLYGYTLITAAAYCLWLIAHRSAVGTQWRAHRGASIAIGVLNIVSYFAALAALKDGKASYVIGFRQLSIALGVLMGWKLLGETMSRPRVVGSMMIAAGCVLIAFAR